MHMFEKMAGSILHSTLHNTEIVMKQARGIGLPRGSQIVFQENKKCDDNNENSNNAVLIP